MRDRATRRRTHRRGFVGIVLLIAIALVAAMASVAGAVPQPGPSVPAAGVGTAAAKNSPNCGPDGKLAYPYQQRAPCTRPLKKGESNGGATTMGVTKDTIKIVLFLGTHEQQQQTWTALGQSPPKDRATGQNGYHGGRVPRLERGARAQLQHVGPQVRVRGRHAHRSRRSRATRRRAQRRREEAVRGRRDRAHHRRQRGRRGQVFAADLVAKKIIVFYGGVTNAEAEKQAPYRWLGGIGLRTRPR